MTRTSSILALTTLAALGTSCLVSTDALARFSGGGFSHAGGFSRASVSRPQAHVATPGRTSSQVNHAGFGRSAIRVSSLHSFSTMRGASRFKPAAHVPQTVGQTLTRGPGSGTALTSRSPGGGTAPTHPVGVGMTLGRGPGNGAASRLNVASNSPVGTGIGRGPGYQPTGNGTVPSRTNVASNNPTFVGGRGAGNQPTSNGTVPSWTNTASNNPTPVGGGKGASNQTTSSGATPVWCRNPQDCRTGTATNQPPVITPTPPKPPVYHPPHLNPPPVVVTQAFLDPGPKVVNPVFVPPVHIVPVNPGLQPPVIPVTGTGGRPASNAATPPKGHKQFSAPNGGLAPVDPAACSALAGELAALINSRLPGAGFSPSQAQAIALALAPVIAQQRLQGGDESAYIGAVANALAGMGLSNAQVSSLIGSSVGAGDPNQVSQSQIDAGSAGLPISALPCPGNDANGSASASNGNGGSGGGNSGTNDPGANGPGATDPGTGGGVGGGNAGGGNAGGSNGAAGGSNSATGGSNGVTGAADANGGAGTATGNGGTNPDAGNAAPDRQTQPQGPDGTLQAIALGWNPDGAWVVRLAATVDDASNSALTTCDGQYGTCTLSDAVVTPTAYGCLVVATSVSDPSKLFAATGDTQQQAADSVAQELDDAGEQGTIVYAACNG